MGLVWLWGVVFVAAVAGEQVKAGAQVKTGEQVKAVSSVDLDPLRDELSSTKLLQSFVVFRHGDRTPDEEELILYSAQEKIDKSAFFPFGLKALTNEGKQRAYSVGLYLRKIYDGLVSSLYLPDEVKIRTTQYDRTKMTALSALAGLYPPPPAQRWNPALNWQPVPYDTLDYDDDDLMYWYKCPRYMKLRNDVYLLPEVVKWIEPYHDTIMYLREKTGTNITTPEDVFFYDNLLQTLSNVGVKAPEWVNKVLPQIKEVTKLEYALEYYTPELIRLASGVLLEDILNYTSNYIAGYTEQPKLRLYSAHENNVAGLLAAARVFEPHQPSYGATFSLELRKGDEDGQYYIAAVYSAIAGGPGKVLAVKGCGGGGLCPYDKFAELVKDHTLTKDKYLSACGR